MGQRAWSVARIVAATFLSVCLSLFLRFVASAFLAELLPLPVSQFPSYLTLRFRVAFRRRPPHFPRPPHSGALCVQRVHFACNVHPTKKKLTLHSHCRRQHSHSHMPLPICALHPPPRLNVRNALCGSALHCMHTRKDTTQRRIRKTLQPTLACSECKFSACVCALASSSLNLESVSVCRSPITFASHSVSTFPLGCFARRPPALCKGLNASVAS